MKVDLAKVAVVTGSRYPKPYNEPCLGRSSLRLSDAAGLTQFGVNLLTLKPGVWSSQRHWHSHEDEFVYVLSGEVVLQMDAGETVLRTGDSAGFKAGNPDGHCLKNLSNEDAQILTVGTRSHEDRGQYSDIDMKFEGDRYAGKGKFTRKNGDPF
jgi:uncharacterized cupin superfamily protein